MSVIGDTQKGTHLPLSGRARSNGAMLRSVESERMATRCRLALLGMVPIVVLVVSLNLASWLTGLLGLPRGLGVPFAFLLAFLLAVVGFFVSRAILRREFAPREPS